ncbi:MAG: epoxyqueuosine reductase QueH [Bdellovibrionales bacterium]|nr:epoxyqueuosine reductase QueH [Bdellovibrionales bacterium]
MKRGKFFLCTERLGATEYAGPTLVYALTLPPDAAPVLSCVEVSAREAREPAHLIAAATQALTQLRKRVSSEFQVLAFLTADPRFTELIYDQLRALVVAPHSVPADLAQAQRLATAHAAQRRALLHTELPHFPLTQADLTLHQTTLKKYGDLGGLYDVTHPELAPTWHEITRRKKLLLHVCCGPDAGGVIAQLKRDFDVVGFWYDPNIQPKDEHDKRQAAFEQVAQIEGIPAVIGEYDVEHFLHSIRSLEHTPEQGAKCSKCYDLRLERAAVEAQRQGCDLYTTTLAISPHKVQEKLRAFGELNERKYGIPYLARNFMKDDGFKDSLSYSREHGVYRQDYCGCWFSLFEGGPQARKTAAELGLTQSQLEQNSGAPQKSYDNAALEKSYAALKARTEQGV